MPIAKKSLPVGRIPDAVPLPVDDLLLDIHNPRLAEYGVNANTSPNDLLKILWDRMAVEEVAMSIAYSGFFQYEPLFVEKNGKGKYVVIEGNRRLAAVLLLTKPDLRKFAKATDLPTISPSDVKALETLPAVVTTREDIWRYLGFKHVNGPSTWGSYAKAQYIAHVHNDYKIPLSEIAAQIGDYNSTVARMYRGLMIVEQAESEKIFNREDVPKSKFHFNYIYTAMDYPGLSHFIGLKKGDTSRKPIPKDKLSNLKEALGWLYGRESSNQESLIKRQNPDLKTLDNILQSKEGIKALKDGLPLSVAYDISLGDEKLFRQSLQNAKIQLQRASGTLATGFDPNDTESIRLGQDIELQISDINDAMTQKKKNRTRLSRDGKTKA
jgi:hypothetical protein